MAKRNGRSNGLATIPDASKRDIKKGLQKPIAVQDMETVGAINFLFHSLLQQGNPDALLQHVFAKDSTSSKYPGLVRIVNRAYFDFLDEMSGRDPVASALKKMCAFVMNMESGFRWKNDEDADHPQASEIMDFLENRVAVVPSRYGWAPMLRKSLLKRFAHGMSIHRIDWVSDGQFWVPVGYIHEHPGRFVFDQHGQMYFYQAGTRAEPEPVPPFRFIVNGPPGRYGNPFGESLIFPLIFDYGIRLAALKSWVIYADKYGTPFLIAKHGGGDSASTERNDMEDVFKNLSTLSALVLPESWDVEAVSRMAGQKGTPHQEIVNYFDRSMTRNLLGAVLQVMEAEHGSRAQASEHTKAQNTELRPPAAELTESINRGLVNPAVRLNFGEGAPIPEFWLGKDDKDVAENRQNLLLAMKLGLPVEVIMALKLLDLPMPETGAEIIDWKALAKQSINKSGETTPESDDDDDLEKKKGDEEREEEVRKASESIAVGLLTDRALALMAEERAGQEPTVTFADGSERRRKFSETLARRIEAIAAQLTADNERDLLIALAAAFRNLESAAGSLTGPIPIDAFSLMQFIPPALDKSVQEALAGSRGLAIWDAFKLSRRHLRGIPEGEVPMPEPFREAAEWMLSRRVMTAADVAGMAKAISVLQPNIIPSAFEQLIREDAIALANSSSLRVTQFIRNAIADNIVNGETLGDFLRQADKLSDFGVLPGRLNGYLENVYRTETALAYGEQRDRQFDEPGVVEHLWGVELFNPRDGRERQTHGAIDGLLVRKGSAAFSAISPGPPWSYRCRCEKVPIVVGNPAEAQFEESDGAFAKIQAIERFNST